MKATFKGLLILQLVLISMVKTTFAQIYDSLHIKQIIGQIDNYQNKYPSEKIYLHFDRSQYAVGDTAWFKGYVLMGADGSASTKSAKLYVEFINDSSRVVQRLVLPTVLGLAQGFIDLSNKQFIEGAYTIRAYTAWMENFSESYFFQKRFYLGRQGQKAWLLNTYHTTRPTDRGHEVNLTVHIAGASALPLAFRDVELRILQGRQTILKKNYTTSNDGNLAAEFNIPKGMDTRNFRVVIADQQDKQQKVSFPFYPTVGLDPDVQFMPEGGNLVAGLYNRVGFKVIGEDGFGMDVKGAVINSRDEEVAMLQTIHKGMGSFAFVPQYNEVYRAKIKAGDGAEKVIKLPAVRESGMVMRINAVSDPDSVYLYINYKGNAAPAGYSLIAQSRDVVCYGTRFNLANGYFNSRIPKNMFPQGVIRFTILDEADRPVNERVVYIDHKEKLNITVNPSKQTYALRDSINLDITAFYNQGKPAIGSFSVSVTDDSQVKPDAWQDHILSRFLLTANLKGNVETPGWYFKDTTITTKRALDNLLLTQGWVGYNWDRLNKPVPEPLFKPEPYHSIKGRLTSLFNKPLPGQKITVLSSGKEVFYADTLSDKDGKFTFDDLPLTDSAAYTLKIKNKRGNSSTATITIDEFTPPQLFSIGNQLMPWNLEADTTIKNFLARQNNKADALEATKNVSIHGNNILKDVVIKGKKAVRIKDDLLYEMQNINEQQLIEAKKMSLRDLLFKNIPALMQTYIWAAEIVSKPTRHSLEERFAINRILVHDFIVDGTSIFSLFGLPPDSLPNDLVYQFTKDFLAYASADDLKDIKVYGQLKYMIVITTRTGKGPIFRSPVGISVYRPLPMQLPKTFYRPRYTSSLAPILPDTRSTIHWEPNLITDSSGRAVLSFYAADHPGTYTVRIEGTDLNGHYGVETKQITIGPNVNN